AALDAPAPPREEAMKQLICLAAKAYGVGTLSDITGYFNIDWRDRMPPGPRWMRPTVRMAGALRRYDKRLVTDAVLRNGCSELADRPRREPSGETTTGQPEKCDPAGWLLP